MSVNVSLPSLSSRRTTRLATFPHTVCSVTFELEGAHELLLTPSFVPKVSLASLWLVGVVVTRRGCHKMGQKHRTHPLKAELFSLCILKRNFLMPLGDIITETLPKAQRTRWLTSYHTITAYKS